MCKVIILSFYELDDLLHYIENTAGFPTIDTDSLLEVVIDKFIVDVGTDVNVYTNEIMKSDMLNDKLLISDTDFVKLNMLIHELLTSIRNKLCGLKMTGKDYSMYRYLKRRSGNIVLLKHETSIRTSN